MSTNILESDNPLMTLITGRNQLVDAAFYDVNSLTAQEWLSFHPGVDRKGGIIVVSPSDPTGTKKTIRHYKHALEFIVKERDSVEAIAIAGVGSSVVGTAALARSVADTYDIDVAGIVSGYGLSDVLLEALGGWYFYGKIDQARMEIEKGLADMNAILSKSFAQGSDLTPYFKNYEFSPDDYVPPSLDVTALNEILLLRWANATRPRLKIRLLVGHSKGNLLISSALNHLNHELKDVLGEERFNKEDVAMNNLAVATFGAVVDLPKKLIKKENQHQFLGTLDILGRTNSRALGGTIEGAFTEIDGAGHHLNTTIPGYLDLKEVLLKHLPKASLPEIPQEIQPRAEKRDRLYRQSVQSL